MAAPLTRDSLSRMRVSTSCKSTPVQLKSRCRRPIRRRLVKNRPQLVRALVAPRRPSRAPAGAASAAG
eukprot:820094-Heterocapsa_arctica.AAC.1